MLEPTKAVYTETTKLKKSRKLKGKLKHNWRDLFKDQIAKKTEQGLLLTGLRLREGYTQQEFGKILGISQTNICVMENGRRPISKKMAQKLAAIFKVKYQLFL